MHDDIRFATWNLNWMSRSDESNLRKLEYLAVQPWDVAAIQEATPDLIKALVESGMAETVVYPGGGSQDRFASGLIARNGFALRRPGLIAALPDPRRGVTAMVARGDVVFECLSWHAPNAAKRENRFVKQAGYRAFVEWVSHRSGPLVVGADTNHGALHTREEDFPGSPFKPFPDDEWADENRWWTAEPDLRDAWLAHLAERPEVLAEVRSGWTGGPSAVSYTRGTTADRFDYVLASPEIAVIDIEHDYEGACAAGSDHGFVRATLRLE